MPSTPDAAGPGAADSLLERLRQGDTAAQQALIELYWDRIFARAFQLLRNREDAEEVAQDTFIRAFRSIEGFRGDAALATWLYQIASNLAHNRYWYWWRRRRDQSASLDQAAPGAEGEHPAPKDYLADQTEGPREEVLREELTHRVEQCMPLLRKQHREILHLRLHRNMSYEDIAQLLGVSVGTVKSRLARARTILREAIGSEFS